MPALLKWYDLREFQENNFAVGRCRLATCSVCRFKSSDGASVDVEEELRDDVSCDAVPGCGSVQFKTLPKLTQNGLGVQGSSSRSMTISTELPLSGTPQWPEDVDCPSLFDGVKNRSSSLN